MRIAVFGILAQKISKDAFGGTEVFTANLVNGLVKNGHDVTLFATSNSQVDAKVEGLFDSNFYCNPPQPALYIRRPMLMHMVQFSDFLDVQDSYDFVHISVAEWWLFLPFLKLLKIPHCITLHNKELPDEDIDYLFNKYPETNFVFAQNSQIHSFPKAQNSFVIHHGINVNDYKLYEKSGDYLSWAGRLVANKGLESFLQIQKLTHKKIKFGGGGADSKFFQENLKNDIENNENLIYLGPQNLDQKNELFGNSKVFINPRIMKPTGGVAGLVVIEANACGTPVIAFDSEGMREVIKNGVNGYLVESSNIEKFCSKIKEIYEMSESDYRKLRQTSRKYTEDNFSLEKMVAEYEALYQKLINKKNAKN